MAIEIGIKDFFSRSEYFPFGIAPPSIFPSAAPACAKIYCMEIILNSFSSTLTTYFRRTLLLRSFRLASKCRKILNQPMKILPLQLLTKYTCGHRKQRNERHLHNMPTIYFISVLYKFCLNSQSQVMIKFALRLSLRMNRKEVLSRGFEGVPLRLKVSFFICLEYSHKKEYIYFKK